MIAKGNVLIGLDTRFGAAWPGQRCGAKTRRVTACQRPANKRKGRCRLHGGADMGPRTKEGFAKMSAAIIIHDVGIIHQSKKTRKVGWVKKVGAMTPKKIKPLFYNDLSKKVVPAGGLEPSTC